MSINIKQLSEAGDQFFPETHVEAVIDGNGDTLDTVLSRMLTSVPLAADGTRGGIQIGFTTNATNRNYAVQLSSEKAYVNVPWTDTTYTAGAGLTLSNGQFSVTADTYAPYNANGYLPLNGGSITGNVTVNGTLSVTGTTTLSSTLVMGTNGSYIRGVDTGGTTLNVLGLSTNNNLVIGSETASQGCTTILYGSPIVFRVYTTVQKNPFRMEVNENGGGVLKINNSSDNSPAGEIFFQANNSTNRNGVKIASVGTTSGSRQTLVVYTSNNTTSPYEPVWTSSLTIRYDGLVSMGGAVEAGTKLKVYGTIVATDIQSTSSDLNLKTNLTPVSYSVADIAKARAVEFDWKDGRGHSMGSIAQDWLEIAPSLIHGTEGNYSLAYGQLALVNTILLARHDIEQDKELRRLKERVAELESKLN